MRQGQITEKDPPKKQLRHENDRQPHLREGQSQSSTRRGKVKTVSSLLLSELLHSDHAVIHLDPHSPEHVPFPLPSLPSSGFIPLSSSRREERESIAVTIVVAISGHGALCSFSDQLIIDRV